MSPVQSPTDRAKAKSARRQKRTRSRGYLTGLTVKAGEPLTPYLLGRYSYKPKHQAGEVPAKTLRRRERAFDPGRYVGP